MKRACSILTAAVSLAPALAAAEAPTVNFQPVVGCFVVGKFPQLNACYAPTNVVKPRVYFQIEGLPTWYYVEATPASPCHSGVLPKPTKKLIGKKLRYYAEGTSASFDTGRGQ